MTLNKWNKPTGELNPRLSPADYDFISRQIYSSNPGISIEEATRIFETMPGKVGKRATAATFARYFRAQVDTAKGISSNCGHTKHTRTSSWSESPWMKFLLVLAIGMIVVGGIMHPFMGLFVFFLVLFGFTERTGLLGTGNRRPHARHRWLTNGLRPRRMHWGPRRLF